MEGRCLRKGVGGYELTVNPESWISHMQVTEHGLSIVWPIFVADAYGLFGLAQQCWQSPQSQLPASESHDLSQWK